MRKTDKKIDNAIRIALTQVCESLKQEVEGFIWLTHSVNYSQGIDSLVITFMFESQELLDQASFKQQTDQMIALAISSLKSDKIYLAIPNKQCLFKVSK